MSLGKSKPPLTKPTPCHTVKSCPLEPVFSQSCPRIFFLSFRGVTGSIMGPFWSFITGFFKKIPGACPEN